MRQRVFNGGNRAIRWLFYALFLLTVYFALTSPNIILGDNGILGTSTTMVTTTFIIVAVVLIIGVWAYRRWYHIYRVIFIQHQWLTAPILLGLAVVWQAILVACMHPAIGFDVNAIHQALTQPKSTELVGYFSSNPNNLPILLVQHWLVTIFHTSSWLFMDIVTTILVDLSVGFNLATVAIWDRHRVPTAMYIHALWLALFPMIIVPYTDAWVLPFVSLYLLCYVALTQTTWAWWAKLPLAIIFGGAAVGAYFMKPSAIVALIAIILVEVVFMFKRPLNWRHWASNACLFVVAGLTFGGGYVAGNTALNHQNFIQINSNRAIPAIHFMSMGVSGDGGYNAKDALKMAELPTKKARADYSKRKLQERLRKMGVFGYLAFLYQKQSNNTADGTFAWVKEGHFIRGNTQPAKTGFAGKLRNFFYLYGTNLSDFRYLAQVWWIIWLLLIALGGRQMSKLAQVLRLTIFGGMMFLLLFEGGRSRYLIQFLPAFLLLATLCANDAIALFKHLFSWVNRPVD